MREILFKAKRIDNGEWVEGYVFNDGFVDSKRMFVGGLVIMDYKGTADDRWDVGTAFYEVEPDTICQYTGLTDKNGNKIWENDVVCTPYVDPVFGNMVNDEILDDYTWKVVFVDGGFCVENEDKIINLRSFTNGNHIKAISNIFDNPELLKGER